MRIIIRETYTRILRTDLGKNRKEEIVIIQTGSYSKQYNGDFREKGKETYVAQVKCTYLATNQMI